MATIKQSNPKGFLILAQQLRELDGVVGKTGWFESSKYESGESIAHIAMVQEMGATIQHPGGTPYKIGSDGQAVFVKKSEGAGLPVTKPHQIIIPPRPMMRPTVAREKNNWLKFMTQGVKRVLRGKAHASEVLEAVAMRAAGDVKKTISDLQAPPLKPATIAARRRQMSNKTLVGALNKPLVASGLMFNSVQGKAEKV